MRGVVGVFSALYCASIFCSVPTANEEKEIVVIIPSYNNQEWCIKNLDSVFTQKYSNFKVIYINDNSADSTRSIVESYRIEKHLEDKLTIINNSERFGMLYNLYHAMHSIPDNAIVIIVDGDDWLKHENVFAKVNSAYANPNVWLTYGSYTHFPPQNRKCCCAAIPHHIIKNNNFRGHTWVTTALRTFYAWLFKKINKEDLLYNGKFFEMAGDVAYMFPMLEMCGDRFQYIPEVLYIYNIASPINDNRKNGRLQGTLEKYIRSKQKYTRL